MVDDGVLEVVYEPRLDHQSVCCRFCNRPQVDVEERPAVRMLLAEHLHRGGDSLAAVLRGVVVVHEQIYYAAFYLPDSGQATTGIPDSLFYVVPDSSGMAVGDEFQLSSLPGWRGIACNTKCNSRARITH